MDNLKEGFYTAHLRDESLLCYVYTGKDGETFAAFPNRSPFPVLSQPAGHPDYILLSNLAPVSPDQHLNDALSMIKFIYQNQGRLQKQSKLETTAQSV
ncbi:MAG: hypothetical protein Q8N99_05720 [Nanoarchaeota archaeon]|nr:hypothetical protein [Nanoarchaeota archaeon]